MPLLAVHYLACRYRLDPRLLLFTAGVFTTAFDGIGDWLEEGYSADRAIQPTDELALPFEMGRFDVWRVT